jgi:hypothetical protein
MSNEFAARFPKHSIVIAFQGHCPKLTGWEERVCDHRHCRNRE